MKCQECKHCQPIQSMDGVERGICQYSISYEPVILSEDCRYLTDQVLHCKDCDHFLEGDFACAWVKAEDEVGDCPGFLDHLETELQNILTIWKQRGEDYREKCQKILKDFEENYRSPLE